MSEIHFVQVDGEKMIREARERLEEKLGERLMPSDERNLLLMHVMQVIIGAYAHIDQAARNNLLRYAWGDTLDAMGERVATARLQAMPAKTAVQCTLSAPRAVTTIIPQGTRVTPDSRAHFATVEALAIPAGQTQGMVDAVSILSEQDSGEGHNGYPPGSINALVDPVPFVATAVNTTVSAGGRGKEGDDEYRERIRLAATRYSTAGPADAYIYHARSANTDVLDAGAERSAPGEVRITILMPDDCVNKGQVLQEVRDAVNDRTVRPLTDLVHVAEAETVPYGVEVTYYVRSANLSATVQAVEGLGGAVQQFTQWQDFKLGRAVNPDRLRALLYDAGAERVEMTQPQYVEIGALQRAKRANLSVRCEVISDAP